MKLQLLRSCNFIMVFQRPRARFAIEEFNGSGALRTGGRIAASLAPLQNCQTPKHPKTKHLLYRQALSNLEKCIE
jgi:hypothetical protein